MSRVSYIPQGYELIAAAVTKGEIRTGSVVGWLVVSYEDQGDSLREVDAVIRPIVAWRSWTEDTAREFGPVFNADFHSEVLGDQMDKDHNYEMVGFCSPGEESQLLSDQSVAWARVQITEANK